MQIVMSTCDCCKREERSPSGWFLISHGAYYNTFTLSLEPLQRDEIVHNGNPKRTMELVCPECVSKRVDQISKAWPEKQKKPKVKAQG